MAQGDQGTSRWKWVYSRCSLIQKSWPL